MKKKCQVVMEFLMDYEWVFLIVLVAFGVLSYLGLLYFAKSVVLS